MIEVHQDFQGRHYYAHLGGDPNARDQHRDHESFALAERFADEWDQIAFDPAYDTLPLEHFEDRVRAVVRERPVRSEPVTLAEFPDDWSRALCVVAHPDDLEYGAAGAIAKWTAAGKEIIVPPGHPGEAGIDAMAPDETARVREAEERASAAAVGVDAVEFLDGHADGVIEYGFPLRRDLAVAIRRRRPEVLVSINLARRGVDRRSTWPITATSAWRSSTPRVTRGTGGCSPTPADEPWSGVRLVAFGGSPEATHFVDLGEHLERGIASFREHAAYIAGLGHHFDPDEFLRGMARSAGEQVGCEYAATFEVYEF